MRVNEIFESIQGEGPDVGRRAVFVRLGGCNRRCEFCDTKYAWSNWIEVDVDEVVKAVERYGVDYVVITGGEPMVQMDEVYELAAKLREKYYEVVLETNGDFEVDVEKFDRVVVSPKDMEVLEKWLGNFTVTLKLVVNEENVDEVMRMIGRRDVYFMPEGTHPIEIIERCLMIIEKMREYGVNGYVSERLHIMLGLR